MTWWTWCPSAHCLPSGSSPWPSSGTGNACRALPSAHVCCCCLSAAHVMQITPAASHLVQKTGAHRIAQPCSLHSRVAAVVSQLQLCSHRPGTCCHVVSMCCCSAATRYYKQDVSPRPANYKVAAHMVVLVAASVGEFAGFAILSARVSACASLQRGNSCALLRVGAFSADSCKVAPDPFCLTLLLPVCLCCLQPSPFATSCCATISSAWWSMQQWASPPPCPCT